MAISWRSKAYDGDLPALAIRGPELRSNLRTITTAFMYCMVYVAATSGSHVNIFGQMLNFNSFYFGLLAAIPCLGSLGQLLASSMIERTGLRKYLFVDCQTIGRLLYIPIAAIPLVFDMSSRQAAWAMLLLLAANSFLSHMAAPAWWTWMADLIPRRIRGRYMAAREVLSQVVRIIAFIAVGIALDVATVADKAPLPAPGQNIEAASHPVLLTTICVIFVIGGIFGAADTLLFRRIRELIPTRDDAPRGGQQRRSSDARGLWRRTASALNDVLVDSMRQATVRNYIIYTTILNFGTTAAGAYLWLIGMKTLGFSSLAANVQFLVIATLTGIIFAKPMGRLVDSYGRRPVLIFCTFGVVFTVGVWLFLTASTPDMGISAAVNWAASGVMHLFGAGSVVLLTSDMPVGAFAIGGVASAIAGILWTGIGLAQYSMTMSFSDTKGRSKYIAATSAITSAGGFFGGVTGGILTQSLDYLEANPIIWGPFLWNNWHFAILLSLVVRFVAMLWLTKMPDDHAKPTGEMVRFMLKRTLKLPVKWVLSPRKWIRRGAVS